MANKVYATSASGRTNRSTRALGRAKRHRHGKALRSIFPLRAPQAAADFA